MPKSYSIASGQFLNGTGKLVGNAQIILTAIGQMFLLAGCDEKSSK
jgi:hypothetical protein